MPDDLARAIVEAAKTFGHAIAAVPAAEAQERARAAPLRGYETAHALVRAYVAQVFQVRHSRQPRLDTLLGCRLQATPPADPALYSQAFNAVAIHLPWSEIEPEPGKFQWEAHDALVRWAGEQGHRVQAGPLIDFSGVNLPDWLWECDTDLFSIAGTLSRVRREGGAPLSAAGTHLAGLGRLEPRRRPGDARRRTAVADGPAGGYGAQGQPAARGGRRARPAVGRLPRRAAAAITRRSCSPTRCCGPV